MGSPVFNISPLERYFVGPQTTFRTIPNTSGSWTTTGVKWLRGPRMTLTPNPGYEEAPYKTGTRSRVVGFMTRKNATWSLPNLPVILSGTPGTAPDMDPILQSAFGQTSTGTTNNVYTFLDQGQVPFILGSYYLASVSETNRIAWGCIVETITFRFNGNVFECDASGGCGYVLDSDNFANEDTIGKAGLTAFPTIPTNTSVGNLQTGFTGTVSIDSTDRTADLGNMTITVKTGNAIVADRFQDAYGIQVLGGMRVVSTAFSLLDSDSTASKALKAKAKSRSPVDISLLIGNTAGYKATFAIKQVVLTPITFEDTATYVSQNFPEASAHASAGSNIDDLTLTLS